MRLPQISSPSGGGRNVGLCVSPASNANWGAKSMPALPSEASVVEANASLRPPQSLGRRRHAVKPTLEGFSAAGSPSDGTGGVSGGASSSSRSRVRTLSNVETESSTTIAGSQSSPDVRRRQRAGSKLTSEEQECFEKIPVLLNTRYVNGGEDWLRPSPCRRDAERASPTWARSNFRKEESDEGKSSGTSSPKTRQVLVPLLPMEEETATVLDKILPREHESDLKEKTGNQYRSRRPLARSAVDRGPVFGVPPGAAGRAGSPDKTIGGRIGSPSSTGRGYATSYASTLVLPQVSADEGDRTSQKGRHGRSTSDGFGQGLSGGWKSEGSIDKKSKTRSLISFRQKMLEKCHTVRLAFEMFTLETSTGMDKELTQKQFVRFCAKYWNFPGMTREVYEQMFDLLDINKDGLLSMSEFQKAIELAGPVRTMEELRRKWIALGFTSMRKALQAMLSWEGQPTSLRLNLWDFGAALSRTGVEDDEEHRAIFAKLREPGDEATGAVSIDLLASAIGAVSPSLVLEDLRDKFLRRHGTLEKAFHHMDERDEGPGPKTRKVFMHHCVETLKCTRFEADKAFHIMDFDNSGQVSRREFLTALNLSEPSLFLEEVRRKVRQRFQSITDTIRQTTGDREHGTELPSANSRMVRSQFFVEIKTAGEALKQEAMAEETETQQEGARRSSTSKSNLSQEEQGGASSSEYKELLTQVFLTEAEIQALFELIDSNGDGTLTAMEFARGLTHFAPSCVLEDIRLTCLRLHGSVAGAFAGIPQEKREDVLDKVTLRNMLAEVGIDLSNEGIARVFATVETRQHGGVSVEELKVALRAVGPGDHAPLDAELRDLKARQQVRFQMAPFRRSAVELRSLLREGGAPLEQAAEPTNDAAAILAMSDGPRPSTNQRRKDCLTHPVPRGSFERFAGAMMAESDTVSGIHGYYKTCSDSMVTASSLLAKSHRRYSTYTQVARHKLFLGA